jgi:uncharacterized protein YegL
MFMKQGLTEIVFILDKSGSMSGLETDTIGGFNSVLEKQKAEPGDAIVTTALFDNDYELLHDRTDIQAVPPITTKEYQIGGNTALIDAIGLTIHKISRAQEHTDEDYRPEKTLFVIITDGQENASQEYTAEKVKEMIELRKKERGWEFIFLGANIDAVETARRYGIGAGNAQNYHADSAGLSSSYASISDALSMFRGTGAIGQAWKNIVAKDFKRRKK